VTVDAVARRVKRGVRSELKRLSGAVRERLTSDDERTAQTLAAFQSLPPEVTRDVVVDRFHQLYYDAGKSNRATWWTTSWLGTTIWKCPLDLWLYQEIIVDLRPDLIIETGTAYGGSAAYLGNICDLVDNGQIVSIDVDPKPDLPSHPRVRFITSSSTAPDLVAEMSELAQAAKTVLVILDSDHSQQHVANELAAYADLVTPGSYVIVEDTNVNGHPVWPTFGPGPMEAVDDFLAIRTDFAIDPLGEKFMLTFNPRGLLKRTS